MTMKQSKHWTAENTRNFLFRIGADFVSQVLDKVSSQNELAEKLKLSKGRVSQTLNNPGNMTLETMIKYARGIGMKVTIVLYDKDNEDRPVHPTIFHECWVQKGSPRDAFELSTQSMQRVAANSEGEMQNGKNYISGANIGIGDGIVKLATEATNTEKESHNG
jgi:transcriptional regulator with XRE-family HTH domain